MNHHAVAQAMRTSFEAGAGVEPNQLRVLVLTISVAVIFVIAGWIVLQIHDAYKDDSVTVADAVWGTVKTAVLVALLLYAVFL